MIRRRAEWPGGYRQRRGPGRGLLVLAVIGVLVVVMGVAVALGGGGGSSGIFSEERTPVPTVEAVDTTQLPAGELVPADLAAPEDYGGFRIRPTGETAAICGVPAPPGRSFATYDIKEGRDPEAYREHTLWALPTALPEGWTFTLAHAESMVWDDGSFTDSLYWAEFGSPVSGAFIRVTWSVIETGCVPELVNRGADLKRAYTKGEIAGTPVIYLHAAPGAEASAMLNVLMMRGNVMVVMETVGVALADVERLGAELAG